MRLILAFLTLLLPISAGATCIPGNAPAGSVGCQPLASNPQLSDYFLAWQPSLFPFSARLMSFQQLQSLIAVSASPGGSNGNIQYNNAGAFGGLTNTQLTADINAFTASLSGAVPASGGGTTNFLRADGTWAVPPGGGGGTPGGTSGQVQFNNAGAFGGFTLGGDGSLNTGTGALTIGSIGGKAVSLGGSLTTSGAFPLTLTLGASTSLTLPASGTLLTTTGNGGSLTGLAYSQLPALAANQVLGATAATTPAGLSLPSCSGAANALIWTTGTGFGCNTIAGGGSGTVTSVGVSGGTTGLTTSGSPVTTSGTITLGGTLGVANGGTGATTLTAHGVLIGEGTGAVVPTSAGTTGYVLTSNGASADPTWQSLGTTFGGTNGPVWVDASGTPFVATSTDVTPTIGVGSGSYVISAINGKAIALGGSFTTSGASALTLTTTATTNVTLPTAGTLATTTSPISVSQLNSGTGASSSTFWRGDGTWAAPAGSGTVTSVGLSLPSIFSVSGSPVTTSGTLTGTLATETANTVLAGPSSGVAATPTFRSIVAADLPGSGATTVNGTSCALGGTCTVTAAPSGAALPGGFKAGRFYSAVGITTSGVSNAQAGRLIAIPFYNGASIALQTITFNVTTVGTSAQIRAAIYTDNGSGAPGTPIANTDTGAMSVTATGLLTSATLGGTLPAGWLWYVVEINNTTAAFSGVGFGNGSIASVGVLVGSPDAAHAIATAGTASVGVYVSHSFGTALPSPYGTPLDEEGIIPLAVLGF